MTTHVLSVNGEIWQVDTTWLAALRPRWRRRWHAITFLDHPDGKGEPLTAYGWTEHGAIQRLGAVIARRQTDHGHGTPAPIRLDRPATIEHQPGRPIPTDLAGYACSTCLGPVRAGACTWCGRPYPEH